jgi:hypothetical protein
VEYRYPPPISRMSSTGKAISRTYSDAHNETSEVHGHSRRTSSQDHPPSPNSTNDHDNSVLIVDWNGPDDPENPRKCGLISFSLCVRLTISQFIVGGSDRNGEQSLSCLRSH